MGCASIMVLMCSCKHGPQQRARICARLDFHLNCQKFEVDVRVCRCSHRTRRFCFRSCTTRLHFSHNSRISHIQLRTIFKYRHNSLYDLAYSLRTSSKMSNYTSQSSSGRSPATAPLFTQPSTSEPVAATSQLAQPSDLESDDMLAPPPTSHSSMAYLQGRDRWGRRLSSQPMGQFTLAPIAFAPPSQSELNNMLSLPATQYDDTTRQQDVGFNFNNSPTTNQPMQLELTDSWTPSVPLATTSQTMQHSGLGYGNMTQSQGVYFQGSRRPQPSPSRQPQDIYYIGSPTVLPGYTPSPVPFAPIPHSIYPPVVRDDGMMALQPMPLDPLLQPPLPPPPPTQPQPTITNPTSNIKRKSIRYGCKDCDGKHFQSKGMTVRSKQNSVEWHIQKEHPEVSNWKQLVTTWGHRVYFHDNTPTQDVPEDGMAASQRNPGGQRAPRRGGRGGSARGGARGGRGGDGQ